MQPQNYQSQQSTTPSKNDDHVFDGKKIAGYVIGIVLGVVVLAGGIVLAMHFLKSEPEKPATPTTTGDVPTKPEVTNPEFIDLQLAVNQWITENSSNNIGVEIYDLDNKQVAARHNEDKQFRIESIYKMFVAYEGYYRIDNGIWKADDTYPIANDYEGKAYTREHCLDHMVRFSYSPCAEIMWNEIGHENLQNIYNEKGFKNTQIASLMSTPSDLVLLYEMFWKHSDLSDSSWNKIKDSMINQTANTKDGRYNSNWRQGLPSGFATGKVYNKVGWYGGDRWYFYDDAAFVTFPEAKDKDTGETRPERHYIVVALTKDTDAKKLVELGRKIELAVKTADNYK